METISGLVFQAHYRSQSATGDQPPTLITGWSGKGRLIGERGRLDVVNGRLPGMAEPDDYYLFDRDQTLVVQSSARTATVRTRSKSNNSLQLDALRNASSVDSRIDIISESATYGNFKARHVRLTVTYEVDMGPRVGAAEPIISAVRQVTDYWFAGAEARIDYVIPAIEPPDYPQGAGSEVSQLIEKGRREILANNRGLVRRLVTIDVKTVAAHIVTTREIGIEEVSSSEIKPSELALLPTIEILPRANSAMNRRWFEPPI